MAGGDPHWPELPYERLRPTLDTLHMYLQIAGKLKLRTPFQPQWANAALELGPRGPGTGAIPSGSDRFSIDFDLVAHAVRVTHSDGSQASFALRHRAVADFHALLQATLRSLDIDPAVSPMPQEVANPIPFDQDRVHSTYEPEAAGAWWRAMSSVSGPLAVFQGRFRGKSPPVGFMWGTFDLRVVRFDGRPADISQWTGLIRRAAMDASQHEVGFWHGQEAHPRAALYAFTYPQPPGIETAEVGPSGARWDPGLGEHLLDWDLVRTAPDPAAAILTFAQSTYDAGARLAGWPPELDVFGALAAAMRRTGGSGEGMVAALEACLGRAFTVPEVSDRLAALEAEYRLAAPSLPWPDWCARRLA